MSSAIAESLVRLFIVGAGALAADLILGRRPGVNLAYQGLEEDEGEVGDV